MLKHTNPSLATGPLPAAEPFSYGELAYASLRTLLPIALAALLVLALQG